jgi:hypothetical protein
LGYLFCRCIPFCYHMVLQSISQHPFRREKSRRNSARTSMVDFCSSGRNLWESCPPRSTS